MYSDGIMGLNTPALGQNDVYPGSNQSASQYATSAQTPVSSSAINAGYDPKTDAYSGQMMARGGIASIRRFEEGGPTQGNFDDSGRYVEAKPTYSNDDNGNLVDKSGAIVATKEARDDPYISPIASDPTEIQSLFDLKKSDPKQFYSTVADKLGSTIIGKYQGNDNYDNEYNQLQKIKEIDPAAYYKNELGFKAHQMGWQVGQNRGERNTANQEAIKSMIPEAQKAGLSTDQIDSIVSQNFGQARNQNVQRIANLAETGGSGFSFQKDVQPGLTMLALAAGAAAAPEFLPFLEGAAGTEAGIGAGAGADVFGGLAGTSGSYGGLTAAEQAAAITAATPAATAVPTGITALEAANAIPSGSLTEAQLAKLAATQAAEDAGAVVGTGPAPAGSGILGNTYGAPSWITPTNAAKAALGLKLLSSGAGSAGGGSGGGAGTQASTQSSNPTYTTTTSTPTRAPAAQSPAMVSFPTMSSNQNMGSVYNPYLFNYQTRNAAQGGLMYADGGIADLGGYAAGGKLLKGPGDGMSDSIVANIGGQQPARLADGEFVIPADVVSHLGNGSTDAGAKHLYKMMDKIRRARTGNPKQGKQINADKFLPRN